MLDSLQQLTSQELIENLHDLKPEEAAVMSLLEKRLEREKASDTRRDAQRHKKAS